jgi:soluble lytic murein transglycosylase
MMKSLLPALLAAAAALGAAGPAQAQSAQGISASQRAVPAQIPLEARTAWRAVFDDLRAGRADAALARARLLPATPLTAYVEAEAILARGAERAQIADPTAWLYQNSDLPQAGRVAQRLGVVNAPVPEARELRWVNYGRPPERARSHGDPLENAVKGLVAADRAEEAEAAFRRHFERSSEASRTLWAQRIAWTYYRLDDDAGARRMGEESARGSGGFAGLGAWTAGLAAWRAGDCEGAARAFDMVAPKGPSDDLASAGLYWAHRAHLACGRPAEATRRLERARAYEQSFYGMLARRALGVNSRLDWSEPDFIRADWNQLETLPGATSPPSPIRSATRRSCGWPRACRCRQPSCGWRSAAPMACRRRSPPASPPPTGGRRAAGVSTSRSSSPTRSRNRSSSPTR